MPKIGIFWFYRGQVFGKACDLPEGQENVPGIIDSPYTHIDLWERDPQFVVPFSELRGLEYQEVPRGRVVYSKKGVRVIVYMDQAIYAAHGKQVVSDFFELNNTYTQWRTDAHYTTDPRSMDSMFTSGDN